MTEKLAVNGWWQLPVASKDTGKFGMTEEQNTGTIFNYRPTGSTRFRNRQAGP